MAIDTRDRRASAIHIASPWRGILPLSDGTVGQPDRQIVPFFYSGITAGAAADPSAWVEATQESETWTARTKQSEIWTERPQQTETWTVS